MHYSNTESFFGADYVRLFSRTVHIMNTGKPTKIATLANSFTTCLCWPLLSGTILILYKIIRQPFATWPLIYLVSWPLKFFKRKKSFYIMPIKIFITWSSEKANKSSIKKIIITFNGISNFLLFLTKISKRQKQY